jgi:hypothetical protein
MRPIQIGQRVEIDLIGLQAGTSSAPRAVGTVVALDPGAITVRVDHGRTPGTDVTVSARRVMELGF